MNNGINGDKLAINQFSPIKFVRHSIAGKGLIGHKNLIFQLLPLQEWMQIVEKSAQMIKTISAGKKMEMTK
jgi:hypothetical protein